MACAETVKDSCFFIVDCLKNRPGDKKHFPIHTAGAPHLLDASRHPSHMYARDAARREALIEFRASMRPLRQPAQHAEPADCKITMRMLLRSPKELSCAYHEIP